MNRYYFFKRNSNIRKELKGDLIDFSLSALYSTKEYSLKNKKEISQFHYFDEEDNCIEDYEEYTNRMQEIWGYDPYNVEPTESYCEKAIHIE